MANKRTIHVEVDDRTWVNMDGLQAGLKGLAQHADDACNFEDILELAIKSLYDMLPDGSENYGGENPKLGKIWFNRTNAKKKDHAVVDWSPSDSWNANQQNKYVQRPIANVNIRDKTYTTPWKDGGGYYHSIPECLKEDTITVMKKLGLERVVD